MKLINVLPAVGALVFLASSARAEECRAAWTSADGEVHTAIVVVDFASRTRLDPAALPQGASALMCLRPSIVPRPDDIRVLSEWRIPFGIAEQGGRTLWIGANAGILETRVEHGELSSAERSAVNQWREAAQLRFFLEVGRRQPRP